MPEMALAEVLIESGALRHRGLWDASNPSAALGQQRCEWRNRRLRPDSTNAKTYEDTGGHKEAFFLAYRANVWTQA